MIYDAMPISTYKTDHTTGKIHPGGESGGFETSANSFIAPDVIRAETPPTASGIAIAAARR